MTKNGNMFYRRINSTELLWDMFRNYMIDGRVFYERVINTNKKTLGVLNLKRLPSETMDFVYDQAEIEKVPAQELKKSESSDTEDTQGESVAETP